MLDLLFARWYARAVAWAPPGRTAVVTCMSCAFSPLRQFGAMSLMPHDLVHELAAALEPMVAKVFEDLREQEEAERLAEGLEPAGYLENVRLLAEFAERAEHIVYSEVGRRQGRIDELWTDEIAPRFDAYLAYERKSLDTLGEGDS